jgi:glutathione S-transferase
MTIPQPLKLIGGTASPYTRKMIALLRYRRIPYSIIWGDPGQVLESMGLEKPRPGLLPTFLFPGEGDSLVPTTDSTPIIRRLEDEVAGRSVIPTDAALAFINYLLEDFGDEWCTKYMFHYRWYPAADADNAGSLLPLGMMPTIDTDSWQQFKDHFSARQIERLWVVGSNDTTAASIDASYRRFLALMEAHFENLPFLLGGRPGSADFAIYGQLTQLVGFDPTPRAITHEVSLRTVAWVDLMEDQTGLEPQDSDWGDIESLPDSLKQILGEVGRVYVPALLANNQAVKRGDKTWEAEIDGCQWKQKTFPYQAKCLKWINEEFQALSGADRERVNHLLTGTGCEALLSTGV